MNKMWMMGYNDGGAEFNMGDSFTGRKLRPLIPRPAPTSNCNNTIFTSDIHCSSRIHGTHDFIALNHHLAMAEQSKRDFNPQQVIVTSRWNPTPEQLQTLEDLYRRGTRTPNAEEIQQITAQLRRYGKIEGKNVFYWFQNHKARERQKRRRQLESVPISSPFTCTDHASGRKELEGVNNRTSYEVEQTKKWANPTNCSSTFSEKIVSREEAGKAECSRGGGAAAAAELGWIHFEGDHHQVQQPRSLAERNATWQMINLSCSSSSSPSSSSSSSLISLSPSTYDHLMINRNINNLSTTIITSSTTNPSTVRSDPSSYAALFDPYSKLFIKPHHERLMNITHGDRESQTLQLFPLCSSNGSSGRNYGVKEAEMGVPAATNNHQLGPRQFFEFLPLKN